MSTRVYLATGREGLVGLHEIGVLLVRHTRAFVPPSDDEEDEYATMQAAAAHASTSYGAPVVVAADVGVGEDVPLERVASIHLGDDLAWFAVQELPDVLGSLDQIYPDRA